MESAWMAAQWESDLKNLIATAQTSVRPVQLPEVKTETTQAKSRRQASASDGSVNFSEETSWK
jgi:hypothetical protein